MTLLSGTLAQLDLATIAEATSLGRSCLRLQVRDAGGQLMGSFVLKAGRIVSATAGSARGREALRVLMTATRDARFELVHEPLDFVLSSAVASVDELASLVRRVTANGRAMSQGDIGNSGGGSQRLPSTPVIGERTRAESRVAMMQGRLDEFDLLTLLQTIGSGRQLVEIEVRDRDARTLGRVLVKSGKVVSASAGQARGIEAISQLTSSPVSYQFAAFRVLTAVGQTPELGSISALSLRFAQGTKEMPGTTLLAGSLAELDLPTLMRTVGASRQFCALEVHDDSSSGAIFLKSGMIVSASAGSLSGLAAIRHLLAMRASAQFRVLQLPGASPSMRAIGSIGDVLLVALAPDDVAPESQAPPPLARGTARAPAYAATIAAAGPIAPHAPPPLASFDGQSGYRATGAHEPVAPGYLLMEGQLADFDVRTLLEVLTATRQYACLQILGTGQAQFGEVRLKAGRVMSSQAGALGGKHALVMLLGAPRQLRFRVLVGLEESSPQPPLGTVDQLLDSIRSGRPAGAPRSTVVLRWAIPLAFAVGGAIVFVVVHGWSAVRPPAPVDREPVVVVVPGGPKPPIAAAPAALPPSPTTRALPPGQATTAAAPSSPLAPVQATATPSSSTAAPPAQPQVAAQSRPAPESPPRSGASVKAAQAALKRLGHNPGPVDNVYGRLTRSAILNFQRARHLPPTGVLDQETWGAIVTGLTP